MFVHAAPLVPLATALGDGQIAVVEYVNEICDRIDAVEPLVHALLPEPDRRARLLADAAALQARFPERGNRPPLYGVPVGVKDIVRVDGFPTRAGSTLPPELFAGPEATVVTALRDAGALILGKTVTTEFAAAEPGPTANPWNPEHTPGGSSSGSAAAVAAGFCPLALGSQTIGSVIRPAAYCGVVGFKPSYGRIPLAGVIPYAPSLDHVGYFTQDVAGLRLVAPILCPDWQAGRAAPGAGPRPVLGIPAGPYLAQAAPEGLVAFEAQVEELIEIGYTIHRVPVLGDIAAITARHSRLAAGELATTHRDWFAHHASRYRPRTAALIQEGQGVGAEELDAARASRTALRATLEETRTRAGLDLWICPAAPGPAPAGLNATGSWVMNLPWTHAGLPAITIPAGFVNGLPVGLQCVAGWQADEALLGWVEPIAAVLDSGEHVLS